MNRAILVVVLLVFVNAAGCSDGPSGQTYRISGRALAYVTIALTGTRSATTTSDNLGDYRFTELPEGTYTITASGANWGYELTPAARQVTVSGADVSGQDFTLYALACGSPITACEPAGEFGSPPACTESCGAFCYSNATQPGVERTFWYDSTTNCLVAATSCGALQGGAVFYCSRGPARFVIPSCG